jgi:hypothetical protein
MNSSGRFVYVVHPYLDRWEVTFGDGGSRFIYDTREEAVEIARRAAKSHWESKGEPAGVRVEVPGSPIEVIATHGTLGPSPPAQMY